MARQKDLLGRLADAGEEAIQRLHGVPGADRFVGVANAMRDRMDELQKRLRGLDELERRVARLEKKVNELSGSGTSRSASARAGTSQSRARKTTTTKSSSGSSSGGSSSASRPQGS